MQSPEFDSNDDEIADLSGRCLEGSASAEELRRLEAILSSSPAARKIYLRYAMLHAQLQLHEVPRSRQRPLPTSSPLAESSTIGTSTAARPQASQVWITVIASLLVVAGVSTWAIWTPSEPRGERPSGIAQNNGPMEAIRQSSGTAPGGMPADVSPPAVSVAAKGAYYSDFAPPVAVVATTTKSSSSADELIDLLASTTLNVAAGSESFQSPQGVSVEVMGPARFGVVSPEVGILFGGAVRTHRSAPGAAYAVQASDLRIVETGADALVTALENGRVAVEALDGEVEVQSRRRVPLYYWTFDSESPGTPDVVAQEKLVLGNTARLTTGIIGPHALQLNDSLGSFAIVEGGTGTTVGTGRFACASGITVEAMFISDWTAEFMDYDEIFRKEDGESRVILSFQNDDQQWQYSVPPAPLGPSLAFGLQLQGEGYTELEVMLDGEDGRPTVDDMRDGRPHHVVATYDSYSGRKSIYIDGQLQASHTFPAGTLVRCGGPQQANIGNFADHEPFAGIIDEVAYYDFALSAEEVANHFQRAQQGLGYFDLTEVDLRGPHWQAFARVLPGQTSQFECNLVTARASRARFLAGTGSPMKAEDLFFLFSAPETLPFPRSHFGFISARNSLDAPDDFSPN